MSSPDNTESQLNDYRKRARDKFSKYEEIKPSETEQNEIEQNEIEQEIDCSELMGKMDDQFAEVILNDIRSAVLLIKDDFTENTISYNMQFITDRVIEHKIFLEEQKKLDDLRKIIVDFVDMINDMTKRNKIGLGHIKNLSDKFLTIFSVINVDVVVEEMDTTQDEIYARRLQEEFYNEQ